MGKHLKTKGELFRVLATNSHTKPGDFPLGSLRSRAAVRAQLQANEYARELALGFHDLGELSPVEEAMIEEVSNPRVRYHTVAFIRLAEETMKAYGLPWNPLPPEQIRHDRKVLKAIDEMTEGNARDLSMSNPAEYNRLKKIVEEKFAKGDSVGPLEGSPSGSTASANATSDPRSPRRIVDRGSLFSNKD